MEALPDGFGVRRLDAAFLQGPAKDRLIDSSWTEEEGQPQMNADNADKIEHPLSPLE